MENLLEVSETTRREIQIISWMVQMHKDRPGLKIKMVAGKKKAKSETQKDKQQKSRTTTRLQMASLHGTRSQRQ